IADAGGHPFGAEARRFSDDSGQRADARQVARTIAERAPRPVSEHEERLAPQMRARVARHGEDVDVRGREAAHIQAGCQRLMWKAGAVLDAAKPLLFNGRHEAPLDDQRGRDVAVICVESDDVHARSPAVAGSMTPSRIPGRSMGWSASRNRSLKWRCSKRPA